MEHQIECFCRFFTTQPFTGVFSTAHLAQVVLNRSLPEPSAIVKWGSPVHQSVLQQ
jgi:hypothetical protein